LKKILTSGLFLFFIATSLGQQNTYWQQKVDVTIHVRLNDQAHSLSGEIRMDYKNNSPDTLRYIWIHLWPNAYKNDKTAFSDQLLENGRTDFYFSNEEQRGYINRLNFKVDDVTAGTEDHPQHQDIIKLILPSALLPAQSVKIETPFNIKLPDNFSRGGHINQSYQVTQWYPKPAVYDSKGWHPMPYLDQGEFYSEFGNYKVFISLPENYVVGATGKLQETFVEAATGQKLPETIYNEVNSDSIPSSPNIKTLVYTQDNIHDFAWFADKYFEVLHDTLQLASKTIDVYAYYNKENRKDWANSIRYIKSAVKTKSEWLGEYPYPVVSVVEKAGKPDGAGMEYPTITLISKPINEKMLDYLINHEVGHNWFYGILASNERKHPWMDEGMNSYYDQRYSMQQYGNTSPDLLSLNAPFLKKREPADIQETLLQTIAGIKKDQPIETRSQDFSLLNYGMIAYYKTAQWMHLLETELGKTMFDSVMHNYYRIYQFKHPYPEDFKQVAENVSGENLDSLFNLLHIKGSLQAPIKKDLRFTSLFSFKETDKHSYLFVAPALGYNFYDKLMAGISLHNYTLPFSKLLFFVAPLYATGSKQLNGIGRISYTTYPGTNGKKMVLSIAGARFTGDSFRDSTGTNNYQPFSKIVPSVKFVFGNKNPRSMVTKYLQWKTYFINETGLLFQRDTVRQIDVISYPKKSRTLNQLEFVFENNRVLYPYKAILQAAQGEGFVRTDLTANYYFNYAKGGGINARFFAGKFFYTGNKTLLKQFQTDPYHLVMTGPKGYEDYNYSNYFYGRNEFEGFANQQIMIRDGAFKVRTDLLSNKIGKTDDWLSALNLTTTIPAYINPLELLPFKLPLRAFADIGTYAEAWKKNSGTPRFLFDAGLQLSFFKNTVNIYVPLVYSKVYKDYIKSTITEKRFLKNISFSLDIQNISLKRLFPQVPF
jgi:hypothetical protein